MLIEKLTPEQEARLPIFREEMLQRGLATGPVDRAAIEAAVDRVYRAAGYEPPAIKVWMDSPLGGCLASAMFANGEMNQLGVQLRDQLWDQLRGQLRGQLGDKIGDQLGDQLIGQLGGQLMVQLMGQLGVQLRDQLWDQLRGQLRDQIGKAIYGHHDLYWQAWLKFGLDIGVTATDHQKEQLDALMEVGQAGWWWPFEGGVVLTDRPTELHRDNRGRLHNTKGPAIAYADGWGVYALNGVRVSEQIVLHPETITSEEVMKEGNAEVRRVMCERMGWDNFIEQANLTMVDEAQDPGNGDNTLRLYDTPEQVLGTPIRLLLVTNATPKLDGKIPKYGVTVPAEIDSAVDAAAWTFDVSPEKYRSLIRAT